MRKVISLPTIAWLGMAISTFLLVVFLTRHVEARETNPSLPPLQVHPLPSVLERWQSPVNEGDYFSQIKSTIVGYLIWSEFPIKVYRDRPTGSQSDSSRDRWTNIVADAIAEWNVYLPLIEVQQPELADIVFRREQPPLGVTIDRETGQAERVRARSAQTRYEFYIKGNDPPILSHRMTILIKPGMSDRAILSATRHELGHALGIWGHSPDNNDIMYYSQVRTPPAISPRDINTLKIIYQQPTRLGGQVTGDRSQETKIRD